MFNRIIRSIKRRRAIGKPRSYKVGQYMIDLPPGHMLDEYQQHYKNYDKKLPSIARLVESKYGLMTVIDIGANIGDTAAALRDTCSAPLVCVEGNDVFLPWLDANISKLPGVIRVVPKYVGPDSSVNLGDVVTVNGTARIERDIGHDPVQSWQENNSGIITYEELFLSNVDLPQVRLIKIDTDGFDFKIILGLINQIAATKPVLFFEFDPSFSPKNEEFEALLAMGALIDAGYLHYVIYDNYGNYLSSFSEDASARFEDLFCFLDQTKNSGGGVPYLDVCCFAEKDKDVFFKVVADERVILKKATVNFAGKLT